MREIMTRHVGVVRTEWSLAEAGTLLGQLEERTPASAWRTRNQLTVAQLITQSARGRRESRGGHRRADYPPRRPERV
jgi:L-aspartate oxidase